MVAAARERVEFHGDRIQVFVIGRFVDEAMGAVLKRTLGAITLDRVPQDGTFELPAGYFLLKSVRIDGDTATVTGTLGPVPAPREGLVLEACGTTYLLDVARTPRGWVAKVSSLTVC